MLNRISNIFISISIIVYIIIIFNEHIINEKNYEIISNIKINNEYNDIYRGYIKYLEHEIPLIYGTTSNILNQNVVGISEYSNSKHLILAGHAIDSVFKDLYILDINSKIELFIDGKTYHYLVDNKYVTNSSNISIYKNSGLSLITCVSKNKRLIIHAKTAY